MSYRELAEKYAKESPSLFSSPVIPFDPMNARNLVHFCTYAENPYQGGLQPCEYTGWRDEEVAWHKTCYIHTGLNPSPTYRFWGPDCTKFLKKYFANTFEDGFPVGKAKRGIMLDEEGRNMMDGMLLKTGENECTCYWLDPWVEYRVRISLRRYSCSSWAVRHLCRSWKLPVVRTCTILSSSITVWRISRAQKYAFFAWAWPVLLAMKCMAI